MFKFILSLMIMGTLPAFSFGQDGNSIKKETATSQDDDYNAVFTIAEYKPYLKDGMVSLEQVLMQELKKNNTLFKPGTLYFSLVIGIHGEVKDVQRQAFDGQQTSLENFPMESQIVDALKKTSGMWASARQNGRLVNCYTVIALKFRKKDVKGKQLR